LLVLVAAASTSISASEPEQPAPRPPLPSGISKEELFGTAIRNSKWRRTSIEVCWLDFDTADAAHRAIVRRAVAETWEKHSPVRFTGWQRCVLPAKGIRIRVADETQAPHVEWIGRFLDGRTPGMTLNFVFGNWRPECQGTRDFCVYAIAAHEFGHALGFTHEQNRPEAPDWCKELKEGAVGDYKVTRYDGSSIMNYCNANWSGDGKLSQLDIDAVQTFYGRV
jgi:hypothetical protein